jgi:hypothetical protein
LCVVRDTIEDVEVEPSTNEEHSLAPVKATRRVKESNENFVHLDVERTKSHAEAKRVDIEQRVDERNSRP